MSRVLVTGAGGVLGQAIVRHLLRDPEFEVRVTESGELPFWIREGAEVHGGDLRSAIEARAALTGCTHAIHCAGIDRPGETQPFTLLDASGAVDRALIGAAIEQAVERFIYVSSGSVFERATTSPLVEEDLSACAPPNSAAGFAALVGEATCRAAIDEHALRATICRPFDVYGPREHDSDDAGSADLVGDLIRRVRAGQPLQISGSGETTCTPTHADDVADGMLAALRSPAAAGEDFNLAASQELSVSDIARTVWEACGEDPAAFQLEIAPEGVRVPQRRFASAEKARRLLGWEARIGAVDGIGDTARRAREREVLAT